MEVDDVVNNGYDGTFVLEVKEGLCNRLRALFSYYKYCELNNKKLIVIWKPDIHCHGSYKKYFKSIKGITVLGNNNAKYKINSKTCGYHPHFNPENNNYLNLYEKFDILDSIRVKVVKILSIYKYNFIAVHIRRTDHITLAKKNNRYTDDNQFIRFINENKNYNLYIATDCEKTQNKFYKLYKDRIKHINIIKQNNNHRQTTIENALIDLYLCKNATKFKGSDYSSFSEFIKQLRNR